ncbi:MAG: hypothetical protein WAN65_17540, partial [Candidatus Sulfotelmatobacter sp.]
MKWLVRFNRWMRGKWYGYCKCGNTGPLFDPVKVLNGPRHYAFGEAEKKRSRTLCQLCAQALKFRIDDTERAAGRLWVVTSRRTGE